MDWSFQHTEWTFPETFCIPPVEDIDFQRLEFPPYFPIPCGNFAILNLRQSKHLPIESDGSLCLGHARIWPRQVSQQIERASSELINSKRARDSCVKKIFYGVPDYGASCLLCTMYRNWNYVKRIFTRKSINKEKISKIRERQREKKNPILAILSTLLANSYIG